MAVYCVHHRVLVENNSEVATRAVYTKRTIRIRSSRVVYFTGASLTWIKNQIMILYHALVSGLTNLLNNSSATRV